MWLGEEGQGEAAEEPWAGESWADEEEEESEEDAEEEEHLSISDRFSDQEETSCWRLLIRSKMVSRAEKTSSSANS